MVLPEISYYKSYYYKVAPYKTERNMIFEVLLHTGMAVMMDVVLGGVE